MTIKTHTFTPGVYSVSLNETVEGLCITNPQGEPHREIIVQGDLKGRKLLETIIHESTHAEWPYMPEDIVTQGSHHIAALLWRAMKDPQVRERLGID